MATKTKKAAPAAKSTSKPAAKAKTSKKAKKAVELHGHWLSQPVQRVALMLRMSRTPHSYAHVDLLTGANQKSDYRSISRFGQVPTLICRGEAYCQSNRILEFLADQTGKFDGRSAANKRAVREWLNWCDDRLSNVSRVRAQLRFAKAKPEVVEFTKGAAKAALDTLNAHLKGRDYIIGKSPTIADISAYPAVALADEAELNLKDWPNVHQWCLRMSKQPGSGHPYDLMPKESRA